MSVLTHQLGWLIYSCYTLAGIGVLTYVSTVSIETGPGGPQAAQKKVKDVELHLHQQPAGPVPKPQHRPPNDVDSPCECSKWREEFLSLETN